MMVLRGSCNRRAEHDEELGVLFLRLCHSWHEWLGLDFEHACRTQVDQLSLGIRVSDAQSSCNFAPISGGRCGRRISGAARRWREGGGGPRSASLCMAVAVIGAVLDLASASSPSKTWSKNSRRTWTYLDWRVLRGLLSRY